MKRFLSYLIFTGTLFAAAGPNAIWQVQSTATANSANSGGFDPGATFTVTNLATDTGTATSNSPVVSSASYNFVAGDVGHWVYIQSGTHWRTDCWFQIASVASNKATLSASTGAGVCKDTTKGFPSPKFSATTGAGVTNDATATITGGTFGIDRSQTDSNFKSGSDLASTVGSTNPCVVTSGTYTFVATDVGNTVLISAGTSWTTGWYEIASVSAGAATLDRACGSTATISSGTWVMGGAVSLGSTTTGHTDVTFLSGSHLAAGNRIFIKAGSYTVGTGAGITSGAGTALAPVVMEGYSSTRGDGPTGSTRPVLNMGSAASMTTGASTVLAFLSFTGSFSAAPVIAGATNTWYWVTATNTSTTAGRNALSVATGNGLTAYFLEAVSYRGKAFSVVGSGGSLYCFGCYFHDSDTGISDAGTTGTIWLQNSIIADNVTAGYAATGAHTGPIVFINNTFYGAENKLGTAITLATGAANPRLINNIFYGFATVMSPTDSSNTGGFADYNDIYNNTANGSNWQPGSHGLTVAPSFTNVHQYTGTGATSSTTVLTDAGANFANVVDNQDFLVITSGSGTGLATNVKLLITGHTSTTLTVSSNITSSGSGSSLVYQVTYGHNFAVGTNLKAQGLAGPFAGGLTTGYMDIGAAQRQESASGGGQTAHAYVQ